MFLDEILDIESLKEYIRVVATDKSVHTKFQLGQTEALLRTRISSEFTAPLL